MKFKAISILLVSILVLLVGCSNSKGIVEFASTDDVQQLLDSKQEGFVIITNETEATFLEEVQKALLEKKETALQFNVFRNDGSKENSDGLSKNPFRTEMPHVNSLYYVKNGQAYSEYNLETHTGLQQQDELNHFITSMTEGDLDE